MKIKHTTVPWEIDDTNPELIARLVDDVYEYIATTYIPLFAETKFTDEEMNANAQHIVNCVNNYEQLLIACKKAVKLINEDWEVNQEPSYQSHKACKILKQAITEQEYNYESN